MIIGIDASRANQEQKTGVEWYSYYLIEELKKIPLKSQEKIILYSPHKLKGKLGVLPSGWEEKVLSWPIVYLWTQIRLAGEMLFRSPDLLFVPSSGLPFLLPRKKVITVHDLGFKHFPESYTLFQRFYYFLVHFWSIRIASRIIVPSEFTKKDIQKEFGIAKEKIKVIPLGFQQQNRKNLKKEVISLLNKYELNSPFFLYVGRLEKKKNIVGLIEAYQRFRRSTSKSLIPKLILVGRPGYGYSDIQKSIFSTPGVKELGYLSSKELSLIYSQALAFVFPSFYEGFGIPLLEAMANGCPILSSWAGSLPEIGRDAVLYCDPLNLDSITQGMLTLFEKEEKRKALIKKGYQRVQFFSWKKCAQATKKVLFSSLK
ncbi:glycosyltransferase family 4 protein [Patescibacteria group bacterium]|nr:glycosyltransferase family 4 protein [Patescibacteria group bacterium]